MSHVPNSAMPHAGGKPKKEKQQKQQKQQEGGTSLSIRAGKIADKARENPKTAMAAGAAIVAGAIAAAAIPLVKSSRGKAEGKAGSKKTTAKKKA